MSRLHHGTRFVAWLLLGLVGPAIVLFATEFVWAKVHDHTYWVDYTSVEPTQETFCSNQFIEFQTKSRIYRNVQMDWHDALYCRTASGRDRRYPVVLDSMRQSRGFVGYDDAPKGFSQDERHSDGVWVWTGRMPTPGSECKLRAEIRNDPVPGVRKVEVVWSSPFDVVSCDDS